MTHRAKMMWFWILIWLVLCLACWRGGNLATERKLYTQCMDSTHYFTTILDRDFFCFPVAKEGSAHASPRP